MPKLAVNAKGCEIDRIMRLTPSSIDPVAVEVPRKDKNRTFQDDLFPDTFARTAAIGSGEYFKRIRRLSVDSIRAEGWKCGFHFIL